MFDHIIEDWFVKHEVSIFSIYILSFILLEQSQVKKEKKEKYVDNYVCIVLDKLIKDEKIARNEYNFYEERIRLDKKILNQLKDIVFDVSNNPNLLQKDKWSSKNSILDQTNKCIPCRRKLNK